MKKSWLNEADELSAKFGKQIQGAEHIRHYTTFEALPAILRKDGWYLRFSDYRFLNDELEGKYYRDVLLSVAKKMSDEKEISNDLYLKVEKAEIPSQRPFFDSETNSISKQEYRTYIACFSTENDSLPLWNYYSGGFAGSSSIDFHTVKSVTEELKKGTKTGRIKAYYVIYDQEEQKRHVRRLLLHLEKQKGDANVPFFLQQFCVNAYLRFKQPACKYESEIRIVCEVSNESTEPERKFRNKNGLLIPYIDLFCDKKRCVGNVVLGPLSNSDLAQMGVKEFLMYNGYNSNVCCSEIKMRY